METLIEAIRVALLSDATDEARHQGALACRTILTALEAKKGEPLVSPPVEAPTAQPPTEPAPAEATPTPAPTPAAVPFAPQQIVQMVTVLRGLPPEQLLDMAIDRLRKALPEGVTVAPVQPLRFPILQLGPLSDALNAKQGGS